MAKIVHLEFKVIPKDILQKVKFLRPYTQYSKKFRKKVFFANNYRPGLVLIKRLDTNIIFCVRKATQSMYETAKKPYLHWEKKLGIPVAFAFIPLSKDKIDDAYIEMRYILNRTPYNNLFDKVWPLVAAGVTVPRTILRFEDLKQRSSRTENWGFSKYYYKTGVYFIMEIRPDEPEEIVYIGQSIHGIGKRVHSHFCKPKSDEDKCYRISYYKTKDIYQYKLCIVEIPVLMYETQEEINTTTLRLEKSLIIQFNPRDNRRHKQEIDWESIPYHEPEKKNYF